MIHEPAIPRLEALRSAIQAARDTDHGQSSRFIDGLNVGLQLALDHIERELRWTRNIEAAVANAARKAA